MKILCLFNSFLSSANHISGGDDFFVSNLKILLKKKNFSFTILTSAQGKEFISTKIKINNRVEFIITPSVFEKFHFFLSYLLRTFYGIVILNKYKFNILFSSSDFFPDVFPSYYLKKKYKSLKWYQCLFHFYPDWKERKGNIVRSFFGFYMQKFSISLLRKCNKVIVINKIVKKELILKYNFISKNIIIIFPSINPKIQNTYKKKNFRAIFLGRLVPSKGIYDIIEIWKIITKSIPDAKICMIGSGEKRITNNLEAIKKNCKLDQNILLKGFVSYKDLNIYFKKSNLFILPSHEEGFGIAILQAMQFGIDIVVWDLPTLKSLYKDSLHYIERYQFKKFAKRVVSLLKNPKYNRIKYSKIFSKYSAYNQSKQIECVFK